MNLNNQIHVVLAFWINVLALFKFKTKSVLSPWLSLISPSRAKVNPWYSSIDDSIQYLIW
ncbi:hypothetical protein NWQ33_02705 [Mycoplasmopsis cynos]|nr:hypothetical protein [Mycoplasmopsis cynos]